MELTPAGEAFLRDAERILDSVEAAQTRVRLSEPAAAGLLRVGATGLAAFRQLPQLARIAARELPGLVLRFQPDLLTPAQEAALAEDRIDLGVLRPPLRRTGLVLAADRPRAARARRAAQPPARRRGAASASPSCGTRTSSSTRVPDSVVDAAVTQACLAAGFLPRRTHEAAETSIVLTLVAAGLGVALLPESALALRVDGVRPCPSPTTYTSTWPWPGAATTPRPPSPGCSRRWRPTASSPDVPRAVDPTPTPEDAR